MRLEAPMKSLTGITFVAAVLLAAQPAAAQLAANSDAPVDITADELEVVQGQCASIWKGKAEALQDTARLRADILRAYFVPKPKGPAPAAPAGGAGGAGGAGASACGDLLRMEAEGSVYYVTPEQRVRSNAAVYEADNDTITMTGDVVAVQGQNVLRGDRMVFNTKTGQGQVVGGGKGGANRPRGVFYPKQEDANAAAKPKPAATPKSTATPKPAPKPDKNR
jgi:lipopolysaccharide export system protein LptA